MNNILLSPSLLRGFYSTASQPVEWTEVFRLITSRELEELTGRFRATGEQRYKAQTLCVSAAVRFGGTGKQEADIEGLTGVGMADFDKLPPEAMDRCGCLLKADPHAFLVYRTISGLGYRVLFRYSTAMDYSTAFLMANCHFADLIGFPFDASCSDLTRISALCHDPEAMLNAQAEPFRAATTDGTDTAEEESIRQMLAESPSGGKTAGRQQHITGCTQHPSTDLTGIYPSATDLTAFAVEVTERHGYCYARGSRNDYLMRCLMFMNKLGVAQGEAERWALGHDLPPGEIRAILRSCYSHTAEHGTFSTGHRNWQQPGGFRTTPFASGNSARRRPDNNTANGSADNTANGSVDNTAATGGTNPETAVYEPDGDGSGKRPSGRRRIDPAEIAAFLRSQAEFRMNVISDQTEIHPSDAPKDQWHPLTDRDVSSLWVRMSQLGLPGNEQQINSVILSDFTPLFHPFRAYFESLEPWDGVTDHIGLLAGRVHLTGETPELRHRFCEYLRKWLVALVAGIFRPEVVNHEILVLLGRQGNYKSTFLAHLLPPELQRYFYAKLNAEQVNKDDLFTLTQYALISYEEIDTMKPADLNRLKALTTMRDINERRAYGRHKEHRNHIASFCASGNNVRFLSDRTGNRRWLPFEVDWIQSPVEHPFDYCGIYSQVWHLFRSGFEYWFGSDDIGELNTHNTCYEAPSLEEELILRHFCIPQPGMTAELISTARILESINALLRQPLSTTRVGQAMKRLGFESVHTRNGTRYWAHVCTLDEMEAQKREEAQCFRQSRDETPPGEDTPPEPPAEPELPF